jgi:hypothetical protein
MRAVLAVGLLIALLGASADAATVRRARHHPVVYRVVPTFAAVPGSRTAPASAAVDELGGGDFQCTLLGACVLSLPY